MSVLVTGATGSLGQVVVQRLLAEGRRVAVLTRRPFRAEALFQGRVAIHEWHPLSEPLPGEALEGVTGVLHLMGEPLAGPPLADRAELALTSRKNASRRLIEAIAGRPIRLVATSLAIAPAGPGEPVTEATPPTAAPEGIERDVLAWEAEIMAAGTATGPGTAVVRLGLLTGPGAPLTELVALARLGGLVDLRGSIIPAIDSADAAAMLAGLLSRHDLGGLVLGVAPEPVKGEALGALLARAAGLPLLVPLPRRLVRHRLGHVMALLDNRRQIVPRRLIELGASFASPDPLPSLEKAIAAIAAADAAGPSLLARLSRVLPKRGD